MKDGSSWVVSDSEDQTRRLGEGLASQLRPGDVVALTGQVGSGKTTFVQGLAAGLGVPGGRVASPSFVLVREYRGRVPLYHADLFRLEGLTDTGTVGLEEYFEAGGVTVIEWANRVPEVLPEDHLEIEFDLSGPSERRLRLVPHGKGYEDRRWPC